MGPRLLLTYAAAVAISFVSANAFAGHERTIFYNGKVFTSNEQNLWAEGVVVEDRFIVAVGSTQAVLSYEEDDSRLVDLQGKLLMPGFNDAHVHPFDTTSFPRAVQLNFATDFLPNPGPSLGEIIDLIKRGAAENPSGTWLVASVGTRVVEDPTANRFTLQDVAPNHPVLLASWYGHGTILNNSALEVLGIGEEEPDPFGGSYERLPNSNVITGVVHEYAEHLIRRFFASQMTDSEFKTLYEQFAAGAARMGYTSVQEFSVGVPQQRHLDLVAQSDLPIRWRAICFPLTLTERCDVPQRFSPIRPFPRVTASGIKWITDGTHVERLAFLTEDYADAPGVRGRLNISTASVAAALSRSASGRAVEAQPMFHAVGDGTADAILDGMESVASDDEWKPLRPRIEHGTLLRGHRHDSASRKGLFVVQNPIHFNPFFVTLAQARFSSNLSADVDPMRSLLDAGVKVAIGSDSVAAPGNPYLDLFFAVLQPTRPSEALTLEQAVIAYTKTSAEAEFQERWKGTLEPGKLADLIVSSHDIFRIPRDAIPGARTVLTMVDGKVVYDDGVMKTAQPRATARTSDSVGPLR